MVGMFGEPSLIKQRSEGAVGNREVPRILVPLHGDFRPDDPSKELLDAIIVPFGVSLENP